MLSRSFLMHRPARERGATLVVALIILVLIMMIGIMAVTSSDTQFRLAANLQYEDVSMNNAEAAISAAEQWLAPASGNYTNDAFSAADPEPSPATPRILPLTTNATVQASRLKRPFEMEWGNSNSVMVTPPGATDPDPNQRYYIELMSRNNRLQGSSVVVSNNAVTGCNQINTYQVTARGQGARGGVKYVQTYYGVLNC